MEKQEKDDYNVSGKPYEAVNSEDFLNYNDALEAFNIRRNNKGNEHEHSGSIKVMDNNEIKYPIS